MILDVNKEKIDYPSGNMVLLAHNMGIGKPPLHNTLNWLNISITMNLTFILMRRVKPEKYLHKTLSLF